MIFHKTLVIGGFFKLAIKYFRMVGDSPEDGWWVLIEEVVSHIIFLVATCKVFEGTLHRFPSCSILLAYQTAISYRFCWSVAYRQVHGSPAMEFWGWEWRFWLLRYPSKRNGISFWVAGLAFGLGSLVVKRRLPMVRRRTLVVGMGQWIWVNDPPTKSCRGRAFDHGGFWTVIGGRRMEGKRKGLVDYGFWVRVSTHLKHNPLTKKA